MIKWLNNYQLHSLHHWALQQKFWALQELRVGYQCPGRESKVCSECHDFTAKKNLERLQFSTSSSFFKIWSACSCEFKAYFWTFWALYHLLFDLETIGVN